MEQQLSQDAIKQKLGEYAAGCIENDMLVGIGTGSTVTYFIESLIHRCHSGLKISAVASSQRSLELAHQGGIPLCDMERVTQFDLTVDGADEIDPRCRMIKGGGGALTREKILATSSKKMVVLVDESKLVPVLGKFSVPIEIIPFCYLTTLAKIRGAGFDGRMRYREDGSHYITDNGNLIFDIHSPKTFDDPEEAHRRLSILPGVVETGFFFNLPVELIVGYKNGVIERING